MSQSQYNQEITVPATANTEFHVAVPLYYERIIITNETAGDVYVATNGAAVTEATGGMGGTVLPGAWRMMGNDQPKQPLVSKTAPGSTVQNTGYQGSTTPNLNPLPSGAQTYVSMMCTVNAGQVALEFV